jgi:preprotein translocase subunit SecG
VWTTLLNVILVICELILIFLVLIQRGKGGGLAGAFGGAGGSSAFGTKAGDVFTKVTMYVAFIWILLSMFLVLLVNQGRTSAWVDGSGKTTQKAPLTTKPKTPAAGVNEPKKREVPEALPASPDSVPPPSSSAPVEPVIPPPDPLAPLPVPLPKKQP